jgi:hypothetical protein
MSKRLYGLHGGLRCDRQEDKQHKTLAELKAIHGRRCPVCGCVMYALEGLFYCSVSQAHLCEHYREE